MENNLQFSSFNKKKVKEIDVKEIFLILKRRLIVIVIATMLVGMYGIIKSMQPVTYLYQTSSRVIIGADAESIKTLQVVVKDYTVLDQVVKMLNLKESSDALASQIAVSSINDSQVVSIGVIDSDPLRAAKIADTTAEVFKDEVPKIVGQNYVRLLSNAKINMTPINPKSHKKIFTYFIYGLVVGIALGFFLESLDDKMRSDREIESILETPVLGRISKMTNKNIKKKKSIQPNIEHGGGIVGYE